MGFLIRQSVNLQGVQAAERSGVINAYVGDSSSHTWVVTVTNSAGWLNGKTAQVKVVKNGSQSTQSATIEGNDITMTFASSTFSSAAEVAAYMQVVESGSVTTIAAIRFNVQQLA